MKDIKGIKIDRLGFYPQKLGDLIYYEGPLLSLFIDKDNPENYYLYKWADNNETINRWIITPVSATVLRNFFSGQLSLRDIILGHSICYSVDIDNDLREQNIVVCFTDELPNTYLPAEKSFFSKERYTEFAVTFTTIITNSSAYDMYKIENEIDAIKKRQAHTNSLIDLLLNQQAVKPLSYSSSALLYIK